MYIYKSFIHEHNAVLIFELSCVSPNAMALMSTDIGDIEEQMPGFIKVHSNSRGFEQYNYDQQLKFITYIHRPLVSVWYLSVIGSLITCLPNAGHKRMAPNIQDTDRQAREPVRLQRRG